MFAIDYNHVGECIHEGLRNPNGFGFSTNRSKIFNGRRLSRHFGTKKFNFFLKSYLFPVEDRTVTAIVIDIHESWLDWDHRENRRALDEEAGEAEVAARCGRRMNRKKRRGRCARRIR